MDDVSRSENDAKRAGESMTSQQSPLRSASGEATDDAASAETDVGVLESELRTPGIVVAALVASAGGLEAFKKFFTAMPTDSGIAFVLIPHLDPHHESMLVELLARCTKMPVIEATEGMVVAANRLHVLPPNKYMTISGGALRLTGPVERGGLPTSIDLFLRSLAKDKREKSICIILSGTGAHGALGLKSIKAAGGMAMIQEPSSAEYPRMPESAVETGLADFVLPVEQMPESLINYVRNNYVGGLITEAEGPEVPDHLSQALAILRSRVKLDFSCYRKRMLIRRIERRMSLGNIRQITEYLAYLREHPDEVKLLCRDLLISVTNFFRDSEAFQALETDVIVPLVRDREPDVPLRVWCAGCATGEEPYSVGILLSEHLAAADKSCPVQIFATDIDEEALEFARRGTYPENISTDVSLQRLNRYFTHVNEASYQVKKQLREMMTFARQNLVSDPPFSKLDLIVCRNLLIYLEPEVQNKVISLLHFSLREGGFLFLGPSETIGRYTDLFEPISKKWRVFRRIGPSQPNRVEIPVHSALGTIVPRRSSAASSAPRPASFADITQRLLLDQFAPPGVLINRKYEILYFFGAIDRYLAISPGEPTQDVMLLARDGLRTKLRSAVHRAIKANSPVTIVDAQIRLNGDHFPVIVTIRPVDGRYGADGLLLVTFQDSDQGLPPRPAMTEVEESAVRQLEYELKAAKEDLQSGIEELEDANEELKVSSEEAMSVNEELQSANEELETSKEELQSLNEELSTVNNQLQEKVADLETANNDMAILLNSTDAGIIFLDNAFRIKRYTAPAVRLFNLIATDLNRPISDITPKFAENTVQQDAEQVLKTLTPQQKQVRTADGTWWILRTTLYRTLDDHINGVVLTFTDITQIKRADEKSKRLAAVLRDSNDAVIVHDFEGAIVEWNRGAERMTGYGAREALRMNALQLIPEELQDEARSYWEQLRTGKHVASWETQRRAKAGRIIDVWVNATPIRDESERPVLIALTERDVSEQKRSQDALKSSREQLAAVLQTAADAIITINSQGIIQSANAATERLFGYAVSEMIGQNVKMLMPPPFREEHDRYLKNYHETGVKRIIGIGREVVAQRKNRSTFPVDLAVSAVDHLQLFTGVIRDITERKKAETVLRESEQFARSTLDGLSAHIAIVCREGTILAVNQAWRRFAAGSGLNPDVVAEGANYLGACDRNIGPYAEDGPIVAAGIRAVLAGKLPEFTAEYPCHCPEKKLWFVVRVTPFPGEGLRRVVIAHEDVTRRKELEREVVEIASLEQRRIGQDLHDSVGQELTALSIQAGDLMEMLTTDPVGGAKLAERMIQGLRRSQQELRAVLRGLLPVALDEEGLMASLTDLVDRIQHMGKVNCEFVCRQPVFVEDNLVATQLYLIANEAVHNAVKHADAEHIRVTLESRDVLALSVEDDGKGMPAQLIAGRDGLGLRIMENRAAIIGAILTIHHVEPKGTRVSCTWARKSI
jgi:two-component system CheB/CheR fusion protein